MDVREFDNDHDYMRCHNCRLPFIPRNISPATPSIRRCPFCYVSLANDSPENSSTPLTPPATPPRTSNHGRAYTTMINTMTGDLGFTLVRHDDDQLEHIQESSTPASKSFINSLVTIKLTGTILKGLNTTSKSCAICTDEFKLEEKVYKLPCSHWFHCDCILPWLRSKNTCPLCRHEFCNTKEKASGRGNQLPAVDDQSRTTVPLPIRRSRMTLRITRRTFV